MSQKTLSKSRALYPHPFSKAYWRDAAAELKDTRMLVFAALMIALRVALKGFAIPLAPGLEINIAFFVNALGAMIFGPVVAIPAACVSDTLGCLLFPGKGAYFFPYIFVEIAGSVIFALFLYRARVTPTRVILARFCICFFVNILLSPAITLWYNRLFLGSSYALLTVPRILKNLFLFPLESFLLTLFLRALLPVASRMGAVYSQGEELHFERRQIALLAALFLVGAVSVGADLPYHYRTTSLSASYTAEERYTVNCRMDALVHERTDDWDDALTVCVVESAYRKFLSKDVTYTVAVYTVDPAAADRLDELRGLSRSPAAKEEALTRAATVTVVREGEEGPVPAFTLE